MRIAREPVSPEPVAEPGATQPQHGRVPISREDRLAAWLMDAHAMESTLARIYASRAEHEGDQGRRDALRACAEGARRHAELLERALASHGVGPEQLDGWNGGLRMRLLSLLAGEGEDGTRDGRAGDEFMVNCYFGLRAAAEALGDQAAAAACAEILNSRTRLQSR